MKPFASWGSYERIFYKKGTCNGVDSLGWYNNCSLSFNVWSAIMKDKTKKKIEAMAEKVYQESINMKTLRQNEFSRGATPWAEWCERLVEVVEDHVDFCGRGCLDKDLLKEYRQWLEADSE